MTPSTTTAHLGGPWPGLLLAGLLSLACGGLGSDGGGGAYTPPHGDEPIGDPPSSGAGSLDEGSAVLPETAAAPSQIPAWVGGLCQTPQVLDAEALLREALETPEGGLDGGLLLCDVAMSSTPPKGRHWDVFGNPPDPHVALTLGDAPARPGACASDTMQAVLSWPLVDLPVGTKIKLNVQDLDISRHDFAGADLALFEGRFPLDLQGEHFRASCRALSVVAVEARLPGRLSLARQKLKALRGAMRPQPTQPDLGFPADAEYDLRRHIEDVAGHIDWLDAQVGGLLADRDAVWADWDRMARAAVAEAAPQAAAEARLDEGVSLTVLSAQCTASCVVRVRLQSPGSQPVALLNPSVVGVRADGWDVPLVISDDTPTNEDGAVVVPPGAALEVTLTEEGLLEGLRPPRGETPLRMLRVGTQLVRLP